MTGETNDVVRSYGFALTEQASVTLLMPRRNHCSPSSKDESDLWGVWRDPNPRWDSHFNLVCLGKRNCKEGKIWRLEGSDEDYSWILKETGDDGLLPQARILLEDKIVELLSKHKQALTIKEIAEKLQTKYEYARRCCIELFDQGRIDREKVRTQKQGRPSYKYSCRN